MFINAAHGSFETMVALGLSAAFGLVGAWLGRARGNAVLAGFFFAFALGPPGLLICLLTPRHGYLETPMPDIGGAFKAARLRRWHPFVQVNFIVTYVHAVLWCILRPRPPRCDNRRSGTAPPLTEWVKGWACVCKWFLPSVLWVAITPLGWFLLLPVFSPVVRSLYHAFIR